MGLLRFRRRWQEEGGGRELLALALPLILSNSFMTLQIAIDRVLLTKHSSAAVGAAMAAVLFYWTPFTLLQCTANYATTFVAQYIGAGRPQRVGPAVWQSLYFSVVTGVAFLAFVPLAGPMFAAVGHEMPLPELEAVYFRCMCFAALPMVLVAAASSFFTGRGDSWTVLLINAVGMVANAVLDYAWITGNWGFPAWGIAGAGWATVVGSWVSAVLALVLFFRRRYRAEFHTLSGWRIEWPLFGRLMWFGLPNGLQWCLEGLAFSVFMILIGLLGKAELAASSIAFTINMVAFLPMLGIGQAIAVLVGQRLGQDRPELAERSTWTGFGIAWTYMAAVAVLYVLLPELFLAFFQSQEAPEEWSAVAGMVVVLLRFIAVYSLFDSMNLVFSFALRGAGDTRFVTLLSLLLSWPIMVLPTWVAWHNRWGLYWPWAFASVYVIALALAFLLRFRTGLWKSMRVIEPEVIPETLSPALEAEAIRAP
jgi:MATE family multidrug resistance protein